MAQSLERGSEEEGRERGGEREREEGENGERGKKDGEERQRDREREQEKEGTEELRDRRGRRVGRAREKKRGGKEKKEGQRSRGVFVLPLLAIIQLSSHLLKLKLRPVKHLPRPSRVMKQIKDGRPSARLAAVSQSTDTLPRPTRRETEWTGCHDNRHNV